MPPLDKHVGDVVGIKFYPDTNSRAPSACSLPRGHDAVPDDDDDSDEDAVVELKVDVLDTDMVQTVPVMASPGDFSCARYVSIGADGTIIVWRMGTNEILCKHTIGLSGALLGRGTLPCLQW